MNDWTRNIWKKQVDGLKDRKAWEKYLTERDGQPFGGAVEAAIYIMQKLDERKPEKIKARAMFYEANDKLDLAMTGMGMGMTGSIVVHFHKRGEEYKKSWEKEN